MNDNIQKSYNTGDYTDVGKAVRETLADAPLGAKFKHKGESYTKTGDDEFTAESDGRRSDANAIANNTDPRDPETAPVFEGPKSADVAEAKIRAGQLKPCETSAAKNSFDLENAPAGQIIRTKDGLWSKWNDGEYMNLATGELQDAASLQNNTLEEMKYTGKTNFEYGEVSQEVLDKKLWEMNKNQFGQSGKANVSSQEVEEMVASVKHYGLGGECQMILASQDPSHYAELLRATKPTEEQMAAYTKEAENVERFIALSDKADKPLYRGICLNSQYTEPAALKKTLGELEEGKTITMGHIASWSTNKETAESYSYGGVDAELDGDNYSIVYQVKNNLSAASLAGINPEGECLSPKSASYRVSSVKYKWDGRSEAHCYSVELEEVQW